MLPGPRSLSALILTLAAVLVHGEATAQDPVSFLTEEMLFHPRADGVTLTLMPAEDAVLMVEYGAPRSWRRTPRQVVSAGELAVFDLGDLWPDGSFGYRVLAGRPGERELLPRAVHGFRTLRSPGASFTFAITGDSHAWSVYSQDTCVGSGFPLPTSWKILRESLRSLRDDPDLDFVVMGTDNAMTKCAACKACPVDGLPTSNGDADDQLDADLRYRALLSPKIYGIFGADLPMLYMLGDHDGEQGWPEVAGIKALSLPARLKHMPNAYESYGDTLGAAPQGNWYAFETGDVLVVALDPSARTPTQPTSPQDWTLGERQLDWLIHTLASSRATFKIVLSEHLLGGVSDPAVPFWKGRGGLTATTNGQINGEFSGEQSIIHEALKEYGAQLFMTFHDHVVVWGEKVDENFAPEGVIYAIGGRSSGIAHNWTNLTWYQKAMDYDGDGVPEYMTGTTGTRAPGWFKVTVDGRDSMHMQYLRSSTNPALNGQEVLSFTILP
jgi:hypothetical protein